MNVDSFLPVIFCVLVLFALIGAIVGFGVLVSVAVGLLADGVRTVFRVR